MLDALLLIGCAACWFGNTGFGLALLWLSCSGWLSQPGRAPRVVGSDGIEVVTAELTPVWLSEQRLCFKGRDGRRVDIYRDEVSTADWAALKRQALSGPQAAQLATGRSTSI